MKRETIIKTALGNTHGEIPEVNAQPINRTEQITDNLDDCITKELRQALADKDKKIRELETKIKQLESQNQDLDYLLNSGRNKFEQERNKRLKDLETKESESKIKWIKGTVRVLDNLDKTKIQGILTSNLRTRKLSEIPYMAFFRPEYNCKSQKHSWEECQRTKCQECEIPVIFRIKDKECTTSADEYCLIKPNLSKGDKVILAGEFANSQKSNRPSFTCYSYQILKGMDNE